MSRGFVKEGDQEEIPIVPPRAFLPQNVPNYVTVEGLCALQEEMNSLKNESRAAGNNYILRNFLEAKMFLLSERINSAVVVDLSSVTEDTVGFGAYVRYNDRTIRIVGVDEADFAKGLLSFISPVAKAMIGRRVGESFEIEIPKGKEKITIREVSFTPMPLTIVEENRERKTEEINKVNHFKRNDCRSGIENGERGDAGDKKDEVPALVDGEEKARFFIPENAPMEFLPVVNERGNIVGRAMWCECHGGNKLLHPAVHLHVFDSKGVLRERYWWHVALGEKAEDTLKRKTAELLGTNVCFPKLKKHYIRETEKEKESVYVFTAVYDGEILKTPNDKTYDKIFYGE